MQKDAVAFMLAGLLFGVPLLGLGILTRTGTWMGWVDRYRSHHTPWYERNFFFGSIPLGLGILLLIPLGFCVGPSCRGPGLALLVLALLLMAVGMVFMIRPPRWMKPAWLIEAEQTNWKAWESPDIEEAGDGTDPELPSFVRRVHGRPRGARPDGVAENKLVFVKKLHYLRLTYQIRLIGYLAMTQGATVVLVVPETCVFHAALEQFIGESGGVVRRDKL